MKISPTCYICGESWDADKKPATEYVKTKRKSELFFHRSCFEKERREHAKSYNMEEKHI